MSSNTIGYNKDHEWHNELQQKQTYIAVFTTFENNIPSDQPLLYAYV